MTPDPIATASEAPPGTAHTLGEWFRHARERAGDTPAALCARTRIPLRALAALESDAYEHLPHPTFAAGFIRTIAREYGLDEEAAIARYRAENTRLPPPPMPAPLRPIEPERRPTGRMVWAGAALAVATLVGAGLYFSRERAAEPGATVALSAPVTAPPAGTAPVAPPVAGSLPPTTGPAAPSGYTVGPVTLTATQDVWVQIRNSATGERVMSGVLTQGQRYPVPAGPLQLWTGRAGALEVRVGQRLLPPLGGPAQTVRDVDLTPEALIARGPAPAAPGAGG